MYSLNGFQDILARIMDLTLYIVQSFSGRMILSLTLPNMMYVLFLPMFGLRSIPCMCGCLNPEEQRKDVEYKV